MRKRFTEEQIKHEAGAKAGDLARKHGVSEATLYNWKAKYGGMDVSDAKRLKALEDEDVKLTKLLADQMRELLSKNGRARRQARSRRASAGRHGPLGATGLFLRRRRSEMVRYRSRRPPGTELRVRLRDLANERRRFGYRRLFILLRREGEPSGINRIYRLCREEGLTVRKRRARRVGTLIEARANARWSLDFVHDQFAAVDASACSTSSTT